MAILHWIIEVPAWGTLYAIGTEQEAEEWRAHKANWEHSIARKRIASEEEIKSHQFEDLNNLLFGTNEGWEAHHKGETNV